MSLSRKDALDVAASHRAGRHFEVEGPVSGYFNCNVLTLEKMAEYISPEALAAVRNAEKGAKLDRRFADEIAAGMMAWAEKKGATHYTHLFQPLTDSTAEKHESFIDLKDGKVIENFSGKALVQQEPDASSFPSGGLRNTFEARGYSAWDPSSPVFVLDGTLCIPSVFVSYTGDSLDTKAPLLRSLHSLDVEATAVAQLFDPEVSGVSVNLGLEQEYFLVDESLFNARTDLVLSGRTVLGHVAAKDQQLEDHYFGAIPSRVSAFMKDFETEAYKLGILLKTRHNEVAPNQFECAPLYCSAVKAIDQNMMLMILMQKVAEKHHLKVIFHEKPFAGVNGSGKHCNWSLMTDGGKNLLSPGKTPGSNLQFLSFFACVVRAVWRHHYLLMASVASYANSFRLGGSEAPPAVMSVFSGSMLYSIYRAIIDGGIADTQPDPASGKSIVVAGAIPEIHSDNTDRNRTSPFAFTGNRFEFRAVGASQNASRPVYILNTIVAESLRDFRKAVSDREGEGASREEAVLSVVRDFFKEAEPVMFEGNGYSREWEEESSRRGLKAVRNVPEAYDVYSDPEVQKMFSEMNVLNPTELDARTEVLNETYVKKIQIEARVIGDISFNHIIPAAVRYQNVLLENVRGGRDIYGAEYERLFAPQIFLLSRISENIASLSSAINALVESRKQANAIEDLRSRAKAYSGDVLDNMRAVREYADSLEMLVDDGLWPLLKYRELLFF